jgi:hypothetical protein
MRETTFDLSGNLLKEVTFGGFDAILKQREIIISLSNIGWTRTVEYNCEEFVSKDTCVLRSFQLTFNPKKQESKHRLNMSLIL